MKTPTTQEAKDLILWLYSTETQYDESLEAGRKRVAAEKALLTWAKKPLDTRRGHGIIVRSVVLMRS